MQPNKRARTRDDRGVNALSDEQKMTLMQLCNVSSLDGVPHHTRTLFNLSPTAAVHYFQTVIFPLMRDTDPIAYAGFHYPNQVVEAIRTLNLTSNGTQPWHTGIVGYNMCRSTADIGEHNALAAA